ncbi:MAG: FAD/NAD(P)-binding protein [Parachlamydia sp.]|nr:FAD/NAD(P)-binding protein [Parachlamydia sp.]
MKRTIAIIGAGFCGTLVAVHLLRSKKPLSLYLIDKSGAFAAGVAYSTRDPHHYLNVPAGAMSALPESPHHFCQWLREHDYADWDAARFMPRYFYHLYLQDLLQKAQHPGCSLELVTAEALETEVKDKKVELLLSNGQKVLADSLVIATGVPTTKQLGSGAIEGYTPDIWKPSPQSLLTLPALSHLSPDTHVALIGSGLTMADAIMSLLSRGFQGKMTILSKHGKISESHLNSFPTFPSFIDPAHIPRTSKGLFRMVREKLHEAKKAGIDWRPVIDSLRPFTPTLWAQLPSIEKKRFLSHLYSLWNHHRHRIPPATAHTIETAHADGKLRLLKGRFVSLTKNTHSLSISYHAEGQKHTFEADHVLNCTGLDYSSIQRNPFLSQLCVQGLAAFDDLKLGLRWPTKGPVYVLGALLFGERFETIAVPELRKQAAEVAQHLLDTN